MPSIGSGDSSSPVKPPMCPDCGTFMRLESASPDKRYTNISHVMFVCDCGRASDQMIADKE